MQSSEIALSITSVNSPHESRLALMFSISSFIFFHLMQRTDQYCYTHFSLHTYHFSSVFSTGSFVYLLTKKYPAANDKISAASANIVMGSECPSPNSNILRLAAIRQTIKMTLTIII